VSASPQSEEVQTYSPPMLRRPMGSSPSPINLPDDMDNLLAKHGVPAKELLTFYKKRIGHHEADTLDALQRLVAVESHSAELHRLRWALRSRDEEVKELQLALSDAKVYLYDERELSLRLQAENDELKAKEMEDRKKISHLLALTEPMAQEVSGVMTLWFGNTAFIIPLWWGHTVAFALRLQTIPTVFFFSFLFIASFSTQSVPHTFPPLCPVHLLS
jgi:hypothetical protein